MEKKTHFSINYSVVLPARGHCFLYFAKSEKQISAVSTKVGEGQESWVSILTLKL